MFLTMSSLFSDHTARGPKKQTSVEDEDSVAAVYVLISGTLSDFLFFKSVPAYTQFALFTVCPPRPSFKKQLQRFSSMTRFDCVPILCKQRTDASPRAGDERDAIPSK